jgi:hypothetical protein
MKCKGVNDKIRRFVKKERSEVHGAMFDNKAFIIPSTKRWNVNVTDKIGRSVTSNL